MKLSKVLTSIKGSDGAEKTAAVATGDKSASSEKAATASTGEKLKAALREVTASAAQPAPQEKQAAAAGSPIEGLTKIAEQVTSAEQEAIIKEANLYGAAVADGFVARLAQYQTAADKVAAAQPAAPEVVRTQEKQAAATDGSFEKFAAENPELVKQAAEVGYQQTMLQMDKLAQAAYAKGHDEATLAIYKLGHASFVQGFEDTAGLLKELRK